MSSPTIAPPLAGHVLGSVNDSFVIAEWQEAGGSTDTRRPIAPLHLHHHDDEAWYTTYLLERRTWTPPVSARHDREHLSAHPGDSRRAGSHAAGASRVVSAIRFRARG